MDLLPSIFMLRSTSEDLFQALSASLKIKIPLKTITQIRCLVFIVRFIYSPNTLKSILCFLQIMSVGKICFWNCIRIIF